jgi:hypothetical protein
VWILEEKNCVGKKKIECEREKEEGIPMKGYWHKGTTYTGAL